MLREPSSSTHPPPRADLEPTIYGAKCWMGLFAAVGPGPTDGLTDGLLRFVGLREKL